MTRFDEMARSLAGERLAQPQAPRGTVHKPLDSAIGRGRVRECERCRRLTLRPLCERHRAAPSARAAGMTQAHSADFSRVLISVTQARVIREPDVHAFPKSSTWLTEPGSVD